MPRRLLGAILRQVAFLLAPETPPFAHQLAACCIDLHLRVGSLGHVPLPPVIAWSVVLFGRRRTCCATCCWFAAGGGIGFLTGVWFSVVATRFVVGLGEDAVLGCVPRTW